MNEVSNAFVCVLGVGTVFVGLVCIVILCEIMSRLCRPRKPAGAAGAAAAAPAAVPAGGGSQDDGVLLAVITAAIAAARAGRNRPASHGARIAAPARRAHVSYYESPLPPQRIQPGRSTPGRRSAGTANRQEVLSAVSAAIAEESGPDVSGIRILSFKKID